MNHKERFLIHLEHAIIKGTSFTIEVISPDLKSPEVITNPHENLEAKKAYYEKAYDDNLCLKANADIEIIKYSYM